MKINWVQKTNLDKTLEAQILKMLVTFKIKSQQYFFLNPNLSEVGGATNLTEICRSRKFSFTAISEGICTHHM